MEHGYLVNLCSGKVHNLSCQRKNCHLDKMKRVSCVVFDTLEDALKFTPNATPCKYCNPAKASI